MKRMVTAAGGGQIVEPTGMNYVGTGPSWSRTVVEELLPRIFAKSTQIAFIEWHTGLGGYGALRHIPMTTPGSDGSARMFSWLGYEACATWAKGLAFPMVLPPVYRARFFSGLPHK